MASAHVLEQPLEAIYAALENMSPGTGYHLHYREVIGLLYDLPIEADRNRPAIQVELGDQASPDPLTGAETSRLFRHLQEVMIQAHLMADQTTRGWEINKKILKFRHDVHKALYTDRTLGGTCQAVVYRDTELRPFGMVEPFGVTVTEIYGIYYTHVAGDMGTSE